MTSKADQIAELQDLTGLALRALQTEMHRLSAKEQALRQNLSDLTAQRATQGMRAADDPALIAGADLRWQQWVDQRRAMVNMELAQVLALMANCQQRLQRAFGRDQVALSIAAQALRDRQTRTDRAALYES